MPPNRLAQAKISIEATLDGLYPQRVFRYSDLRRMFSSQRSQWLLGQASLDSFVTYLQRNSHLRKIRVELPYRAETLFVWREVSEWCMACALKGNAYLSHFTALQFHELTEQVGEIIYVNHEQRAQPKPVGELTQEAVDRAFRVKQRMNNNIAMLDSSRVCVLNGKQTGQLGVIDALDRFGCPMRVTSLERTLIDATVRPAYSGGVGVVLDAYRRSADRVQVNKMLGLLAKLDYKYPYDQAVGYYMERSGAFEQRRLRMVESRSFNLKFYLSYGMKSPEFSSRWNVWHPQGL